MSRRPVTRLQRLAYWRQGIGRGGDAGGGGETLPVITNFAFDAITEELSFECNTTGTLTYFFDLTASYASGNLAAAAVGSAELSGTMAVTAGLFDGTIDVTLLPVGNWYLHIYVSNGAGNSNCESTAYERVADIVSPNVTYLGNISSDDGTNSVTGSIDIGSASAGRLIVGVLETQVGTQASLPTLVVAGTSLGHRQVGGPSDYRTDLLDALVTTGSGAQTVTATWANAAFTPKIVHLWSLTGQASNTAVATGAASGGGGIINIPVNEGEALIVGRMLNSQDETFANSPTQAPDRWNSVPVNAWRGISADWIIDATTADFDTGMVNGTNSAVYARYM